MKIALTGSAGFLGRAVQRLLEEQNHTVVGIDSRSGVDVRDADSVRTFVNGCDAVVHLAGVLGTAELFDDVSTAVEVNVGGTVNVLDACLAHGARYVGVAMPDVWPSVYQATKLCGVRLAEAYQHAHGLPVAHVRAFNAYGPGQAHGPGHPQKIIPTFATQAHRHEPLPVWGDGQQTVDLIHVDDIAAAFGYLLSPHREYGLHTWEQEPLTVEAGSGVEVTVLDVARRVCEIADAPFVVGFLPMRAGELPGTRLCAKPWYTLDHPPLEDPRLVDTVMSYKSARRVASVA